MYKDQGHARGASHFVIRHLPFPQSIIIANLLVIGIVFTMKQDVTIDKVGRLVLPKSVREALGIRGRMEVAIEVVSGAARISIPPPPPGPTKQRRGRMVYSGPLPEDWDSADAVARMREQRIRR